MCSLVSSAAVQLTPILLSYLPNIGPGAIVICFTSRHPLSSCSPNPLSPPSPSGFSTSTPWPFRSPVSLLLSRNVSFPIVPYHIVSRSDLDLLQQSKISRPGTFHSSQPSRVSQRVHSSKDPNARFRTSCSRGRLKSNTCKTSWPWSTSSPSRTGLVVFPLVSPRTGPSGPEPTVTTYPNANLENAVPPRPPSPPLLLFLLLLRSPTPIS